MRRISSTSPAREPGGAFFALGLQVYRARRPILVLWGLLLVASLPLALGVFKLLQPGGLSSPNLESARASTQLQQELGYNPSAIVVVFTSDQLRNDDARWIDAENAALTSVRQLPEVAEVTTRSENARQVSPDGQASYVTIALAPDADQLRSSLGKVEVALQPTELNQVVTGAPVFYADILEVTEHDIRRAELISLPFAILAMVWVFGSLVAAASPARSVAPRCSARSA